MNFVDIPVPRHHRSDMLSTVRPTIHVSKICCCVLWSLTILILTNFTALAGPVKSEPLPESIRLPDVLQIAIRQNPSLASARVDVSIARARALQTIGINDIRLQVNGEYGLRKDPKVDGNLIGSDANTNANTEISANQLLPTGGTLSLRAANSRRSSTFSFNGTKVIEYNSEVSANLDQPLLRGRGKTVSQADHTRAKHSVRARELDLRARAQDEIRGIIDVYWELVWAHNDLAIRMSAQQLAQARLQQTESAIAVGSSPGTALLAVEQVITTNEEEILLAQQRVTERSLELRRLSGLEIGPGHIDLQPVEPLRVSPKAFALHSVVAKAFQESPQLAALAERKKEAQISVEVADNGMLPSLNFSLTAGPLGTDSNLADSLRGVTKLKGYFIGAGLRYENRIGARSVRGTRDDASARVLQAKLNSRNIRAQIATAASTAVRAANIAQKRMELSKRAISLSEKNIESEKLRFQSGRSTNFDVLERQEEMKQARLRHSRAAVDYLRASTSIQALRGELLSAFGIELDYEYEPER